MNIITARPDTRIMTAPVDAPIAIVSVLSENVVMGDIVYSIVMTLRHLHAHPVSKS